LAQFYRESIEILFEASGRLGESSSAVSDAAYARATDTREASGAANAAEASRTTTAHVLAGGAVGLPAVAGLSTHEGFFTERRLSGDGQRALEFFRAAAQDPDLIRSVSTTDPRGAITIEQLLVGGNGVAVADSVAFRIGVMQDRADLRATGLSAQSA